MAANEQPQPSAPPPAGGAKRATSKKRPLRKVLGVILGIAFIIFICAYAWLSILDGRSERDLRALKAMGVPTTVEDYRLSVPHDGRDGGKLYDAAFKSWDTLSNSDKALIGHDYSAEYPTVSATKVPPGDRQRLSDFLDSQTTLFRRAAATDWCDFSLKQGRPLSNWQTNQTNGDLMIGIRLLAHSAEKKSPGDEGFLDIYYASRIAANSARSALGLSEIIGANWQENAVMQGWQRMLARADNEPQNVQAASRVLYRMQPLPSLRHIMESEFVASLWETENARQYENQQDQDRDEKYGKGFGPPQSAAARFQRVLIFSRPANAIRRADYIRDWRVAFDNLPKDPEDFTGYEAALLKALKDSKTPGWVAEDTFGSQDLTISIMYRRTERLADRRIAKVSLELLKDRMQTGQLPAKLPDLGTDSIDPFTGKPLIYKTVGKGFMVYSVGRDLTDDHGTPAEGKTEHYDIVQSYP
jgi:hypothetical protein